MMQMHITHHTMQHFLQQKQGADFSVLRHAVGCFKTPTNRPKNGCCGMLRHASTLVPAHVCCRTLSGWETALTRCGVQGPRRVWAWGAAVHHRLPAMVPLQSPPSRAAMGWNTRKLRLGRVPPALVGGARGPPPSAHATPQCPANNKILKKYGPNRSIRLMGGAFRTINWYLIN